MKTGCARNQSALQNIRANNWSIKIPSHLPTACMNIMHGRVILFQRQQNPGCVFFVSLGSVPFLSFTKWSPCHWGRRHGFEAIQLPGAAHCVSPLRLLPPLVVRNQLSTRWWAWKEKAGLVKQKKERGRRVLKMKMWKDCLYSSLQSYSYKSFCSHLFPSHCHFPDFFLQLLGQLLEVCQSSPSKRTSVFWPSVNFYPLRIA